MNKKYAKNMLRRIQKAFNISDSSQEYEDLCECIYYSDCKLEKKDFYRLKKLVC